MKGVTSNWGEKGGGNRLMEQVERTPARKWATGKSLQGETKPQLSVGEKWEKWLQKNDTNKGKRGLK